MKQQINLYQGIIRQDEDSSFLNLYSGGFIVIALLLMGIGLYSLLNVSKLKAQVEQARQNLIAEEARITDLMSKLPKQESDSVIVSQVTLLQNKVNELSRTVQLLTEQNSDMTEGFSHHFQALADQSIPDIWLSRIYIIGPRRIVNLEGSTFKSEQIPRFLQLLQKEPVFQGQTFAKLNMLKSEKIPGQIDFNLNTTTDLRDSHEPD
jgi:hypothetical protein